jgi:hypothetical protein
MFAEDLRYSEYADKQEDQPQLRPIRSRGLSNMSNELGQG